MFGRFFDYNYHELERSLRVIAQESIQDTFEIRMQLDDSLALSRGRNELKFLPSGSVAASIFVGSKGADMSNPEHIFTMVEDFYHELRHVEHHVEAYQGNGFSNQLNTMINVAYLAREQDAFRYKAGYYQNIFETDAHLHSVIKARDFCVEHYPGVDFDGIAVSLWKGWSKFENARFIDNPDDCHSIDDIVQQLQSHLDNSVYAFPVRCNIGSDMYDYLKHQASDEFLDKWINAKNDMARNVLSAALFSVQRPDEADRIVPKASATHFCFDGFDATSDVCLHRECVYDRDDVEIFSKLDVANMLRSAFYAEHDALVVKCDYGKARGIVTIDGTGYRVTHTALGEQGFETFLFDDDACVALDKIVDSLSCGETYVLSGALPYVVLQMVDSCEQRLSLIDVCSPMLFTDLSQDVDTDDFELG